MCTRIWIVPFAVASMILAGCGGGPNAVVQSAIPKVNLRAINLIPSSPKFTVRDGSVTLGTISEGQATPYSVVNPGLNPVVFDGPSGQVASFQGQLGYGGYATVAICLGPQADATFALPDAGSSTAPGTSRVRIADAISQIIGNVNVYLAPGDNPTSNPSPGTLISGAGIGFGAATAYASESPGAYTITMTSAIDPSAVVLSQVVTLQPAQAVTVYVLTGGKLVFAIDGPQS